MPPLLWAAIGWFAIALPAWADTNVRLRLEWGGGAKQQWIGSVALSAGALSDPRILGVEADAAKSIWLDGGELVIRQPGPRIFDGVEVTADAPDDARLLIRFTPQFEGAIEQCFELSLADLALKPQTLELDDASRRLMVRRAPGDLLRVSYDHASLVFDPAEHLLLAVEPHQLDVAPGTPLRIEAQLMPSHSATSLWPADRAPIWSTTVEPSEGAAATAIALDVPLPAAEGVYDLSIVARPYSRLARKPIVAERKVQVVVIDPAAAPAPVAEPAAPTLLAEIDPANPGWWNRMSNLSLIPSQRKGPWGDGEVSRVMDDIGQLVRLGPGRDSGDIPWQAFPLPVTATGVPHVLEVDYAADAAQSLGISIVEPNAAGAVAPITLDSGVYVNGDDELPAGRATHRLVFWPRTKTPIALLTNRRPGAAASYGKLRLLSISGGRLRRAFPPGAAQPQRLLAGYLDRPLLPEHFLAPQTVDGAGGRVLDDWVSFYASGTRLVDYLNHIGRNGLMLSVLADGGTIYPSQLVAANPRYDTGIFHSTGQDPHPKDVLELMFRLFDREGLRLIPVVQFSTPLPQLERIVRQGGEEAAGIECIGPEGEPWTRRHPPQRGLAPYYNALDPRVRAAMRAIVRELIERYSEHPSFAGVGVELSAEGYAQLPGPRWGLDDATIARFQTQTGRSVPGIGQERFARRAEHLTGKGRSGWLEWRAEQLEELYRNLQADVVSARSDARLYLLGAGMFDNHELARDWRPALPRREPLDRALLDVGIAPDLGRRLTNAVLLRPQAIAPPDEAGRHALTLDWNESPEVDQALANSVTPGSLLYHPPLEAHLPSFDAKGPFHKSNVWLVAQLSPSGNANRRRFTHSLATLDAQVICDGGWMLPLGQEDAVTDFVKAFRQLPAGPFATVEGATQPVTIRTLTRGGRTYAYLVNDSPWNVHVLVSADAPEASKLTGLVRGRSPGTVTRNADGLIWELDLRPYDVVAASFSAPDVELTEPRVAVDPEVIERLEQRIERLQSLAGALQSPAPHVDVLDAGFEAPAAADGRPAAWTASETVGITAALDQHAPYEGRQALQFASDGPAGLIVSEPFEPPFTGRLTVSAWLRVADAERQPKLRLAVEGRLDGREYYRHAPVGEGSTALRIDADWAQYVFQITDLPTEGLTDLRVRFDLLGPGQVWIDNVQLFDLVFTKDERIELDTRIIALARAKLRRGELADCQRLLDGYWPRFLQANIRPSEVASQPPRQPPRDATPPAEARKPTWMDRFKEMLPERMRF